LVASGVGIDAGFGIIAEELLVCCSYDEKDWK